MKKIAITEPFRVISSVYTGGGMKMIEGTTVTKNYDSTISYFTPKTMTLKEILKSWINGNLGEGFRFEFVDVEFVVEDKKIRTVNKFRRNELGYEDYEDLFDWVYTDSLDEEVKITNYVYSVSLKYDDSYNYEPKIYNTNREVRCCPVCGGNGIVSNGFYNHTGNTWVTSTTAPEQCRSCNGKGYVEI